MLEAPKKKTLKKKGQVQSNDSWLTNMFRYVKQSRDENFIGYDKYRVRGAHHWIQLEQNTEGYRDKVEVVLKEVKPQDTCLDAGCGDGAYVAMVAQKCARVFGVDADFDAIRHARTKLAEAGVQNAHCIQKAFGAVTRWSFGLNRPRFDLMYSMDVIEHLPDPTELLKLGQRLVKPGGTLVIGTPLFITKELISKYHVTEFSLEEIRGLLSRYFVIEKEMILPTRREDDKIYENGFYLGICKNRTAN